MPKKRLSLDDAISKIRTFCNYRDRCHKEVREKLYAMGLYKKEVDRLLLQMMDEDLLNEERFARSFARGYFRTKQWGKFRIQMELKQRQINDRLIELALTEIDDLEYKETLKKLIEKKCRDLKGNSKLEQKKKLSDHLLRKGYSWREFQELLP